MKDVELSGRTALVTGASAGIGREIARVLARDVGTLILVARRRERLDEVAAELGAGRPSLRVLVRPVDLLDRAATGALLDALEGEGEQVDVLVNNAGFGDYAFFTESAWSKLEPMLELNVVSATYLLHRLVPGMVSRGFGAILNVGSCAGIAPSPQMVAYSATKAYINLLSEGLRAELAGTGVSVTNLSPGPIPTEFQEVAGGGRP
ncbi:MAG TPA: SDR family NAD(P)-dependent oxidoreductase, partial [Candidatus Nanopelagicales bacterium]|nr:SDR family NAD(P)-dependent oxidoreductase [Candidatus Nanopelagicales bacterium]